MEIPFIGGAYKGRSTNLNAQVCQNFFLVADQRGAKSQLALMGTPGLRLWVVPAAGVVRGALVMGAYLYSVIGNTVYRTDSAGTSVAMTGALGTSTGFVWMRHNGTQLMITDGAKGYIVDGAALTEITAAGFGVPSWLAYQDGYFIVGIDGTPQFQISESYDGTIWDAADYASAEGYPDNVTAGISANREIWLLGPESYEVWYNSGDSTFPFDRVGGAVFKIGIGAPASLAEYQGTVMFMDNERRVRRSENYGAAVVSTEHIDYALSQYSTVSDAIAYMYHQEGHVFYVLTFPTEGKTWCYDLTTDVWHTRTSGEDDGRHPANCYALFDNRRLVGDSLGNLLEYDFTKFSDNGALVRRIRTAQALTKDRKLLFHGALEIEFEAGVGLAVADPDFALGEDPVAVLDWSDDGGHTWSNEYERKIGKIGEYTARAVWRGLGRSRDRIYRVTVVDPVKVVIIGAHLEAR